MDNKEDLKLFRVGKDVPKGYEVVETGDKIDLSDETIDALALKAVKDGTIQLARKKQGDKEQKGEIIFKRVRWAVPGRLATVDEVKANFEQARGLLNEWTLLLLDGGKLCGTGYGSVIEEGDFSEDPNIGEKLIVIEGESLCEEEMKETVEGKSTTSATPDEPKKEANLGDFIGAMGGLMAAFAPGEEGQQIQKEVNQMAAMFGASPGPNKKEKSKKTMPATVSFIFRPQQEAKLVEIAGSFNDWSKVAMTKDGGHWRVSLRMKPGRHQYRYIVDGEVHHDDNLPTIDDKHGGFNNVINVDYEDDYKKCPSGHPLEIGDVSKSKNCHMCQDAGVDSFIQAGDPRYVCSACGEDGRPCGYLLCERCYNSTEAVVTSFGKATKNNWNSLGTFIRSPELQKAEASKPHSRSRSEKISTFPIYKKVSSNNEVELLFLDVQDKDSETPDIGRWRISSEYIKNIEGEKAYRDGLKHSTDLNVEDRDESKLPPKTGWMFPTGHDRNRWFKDRTIEVLLKEARKTNIMFVKCSGGSIPPNAVPGGKDENGETLYVGRAMHGGSLVPGKLQPSAGVVYVSYGGKEHAKDEYEVLVQEGSVDNLRWVKDFHHYRQDNIGSIVCGYEENKKPLYVARATVGDQLIVGKVEKHEVMCYLPLNGEERLITDKLNVEVLCCNELAVKEYNSDGALSTKGEPGEADKDEEDNMIIEGNMNQIQCAQQ